MKKTSAAAGFLAAMMAMTIMSSCGSARNSDAATFTAKPTEQVEAEAAPDAVTSDQTEAAADPETLKRIYKKPAEFSPVDMTAEDPSTAEIKFIFDEKGRVSGIYYMIDDHLVMANYGYNDEGGVKIVVFAESTLVDVVDLKLPAYDESVGITEHGGYYFKGYKFE